MEIVGESRMMCEVLGRAEQLADVPRPILIRGERGTGKELLASFVHANSARSTGPFAAVNCAVYSDELLASELFGHEKGAFTGADARRAGCIERAEGGTLFLDEIGNMSPRFQEKMLRVIETRQFERVGGTESLTADVRFISATNADIQSLIDAGEFRADFHDRIAFDTLDLPPLRERKDDVPLLVRHFSVLLLSEVPNLEIRRFSPEAMRLMTEYYWPGNVRELKNVVERLQLREGEPVINTAELPQEITAAAPSGETFEEKVEAYRQHLILSAWRDCAFNQRKAAEKLGMSYDQFRHYFRKYGLKELLP
ncbi:sigma 54-interacting transcriptional regulator [Planctomycetota bacterium]